jgi:hypothetical protein
MGTPRSAGAFPSNAGRAKRAAPGSRGLKHASLQREASLPCALHELTGSPLIPVRIREAAMLAHCHGPPTRADNKTGRMGTPYQR